MNSLWMYQSWNGDRMNKGMIKSTIREIKGSFGRYMAILLIVALGVGFFSGLQVAYDAMVYTADAYLDDLNFFDYRLLSTLGFDEETADVLAKEEGVLAAEGSKSADVLIAEADGTERVVKTISFPQKVNTLDLTAGRMPEAENECVVDRHAYSEADIGRKLTIAESNEKEDQDKFSVKEYTIVGIVRSPLYIHYDRGNTSVGDGAIDGFVYLMKEAYDMDYDTEIYIAFDKDAAIYSEEYDNLMDSREEEWKEICQREADFRYHRIYTEAQEEIEDADTTLQEKKADGEKELAEARDTLTDGENEIANGKNAISEAKRTLSDNKDTLEEKEEEYKKGLKVYKKNKAVYDKGKKAYDKGVNTYNTQYAEYEKNLTAYEANQKAYDRSEQEYAKAKEQYESGKAYLSEQEQKVKEQEFAAWRATLDATGSTLAGVKSQLDAGAVELKEAKKNIDTEGKKLSKADKQLKKAKKELDEAGIKIEEAKKQFSQAERQISEKERELVSAEKELANGRIEYDDAKKEYDEKIADAGKEIADAREELKNLEKPESYVLGRETNTGYAGFDNDAQIVKGIAKVFPIFFFLVAALVCMTTMARMMEEQRTQIGVLKALGYSNAAIIGKYMVYSGSGALMGAVGGYFAGTWTFSIVIWNAYKMMYDMGSLHYVLNSGLAVISVLVALLCSAGTTFVVCYQELREMAAALMRPKTPKAGKRVLLEKIPFIWKHLKFLDKVSVRNLFRYKRRFFMMIIGISGCTALLVTGMGVRDSIANIADTQFEQIFIYDIAADIREEEVKVPDIKESLLIAGKSVDLQTGGEVKSVYLMVPDEKERFSSYVDLHTEEGEQIDFPENGKAVISSKLAENYGIGVGDTVTLQNSDLKGGTVMVSGIYQNYFNHYVIMTPVTYEQLFKEKTEYNEMYVNIEENADVYAVASALMKEEDVSMVTVSADIKKRVSDMMGSLDYVVILVIICAAMLAFIVIYNLNNINITERIREIATIKVLGFYKEETNSYIFRENTVLTLFGSLVGILLGHYLHRFVMSQIKIDAVAFDVRVTGLSFILSIILTLLFNQIVNLFMSKKLENIDMAESLKSVE